ncbi:DUF3427 domain-containing protein [Flaviaesturariibacter aridisoli]|uniref:DUF3427 domain-containing protein n=2 Tax=Flaviaesturariibacter aridisoli TaxID=2545761 RepID=A0A4R4E1A0_9BACT|nr:DUF3427 domain-containing protein [Flaviaesturariibacter aridisoli]
MKDFQKELHLSLQTGFIDRSLPSLKNYQPQLLYNSKEEGVKILATLHHELRRCDEFWFSVAFVTKDGVATVLELLKELEFRKVRGQVLVSQYLNFTQPEALKALLQFKNIELRIVQLGGFHAKGYIFRSGSEFSLIIGSSNLTASALCVNKEWNLKVSASFESSIVTSTFAEFNREFSRAAIVDQQFIDSYTSVYQEYRKVLQAQVAEMMPDRILPNKMQVEALKNLEDLRARGASKALLISATGTGKTYLSAFDVRAFQPRKVLFIVHRENIARASLRSYQRILGPHNTMGLFTGGKKEVDCDFLFCTVQTLSLDKNLELFSKEEFDYIVIDETHRSGAQSYQKILNYFRPVFLLGMTATPERTDGLDIFRQFDYNIAYEIRLQKALEEDILCNFHYFGVADIFVDGDKKDDRAVFNKLVADNRVEHIIEKARFYGCDNGIVRGLIFCSSVEESRELAQKLGVRGIKAIALTGESSENERELAIRRLESDGSDKIDYILTRDIFNEGVDIPKVNQVILLRPTESAIVFVQQLGRGLRKADDKEYLTVIDFIGNYRNNYLVPVALFGDTSYNKDRLRKLLASGSGLIPGASTVNFDAVAKRRIYEAINSANMSLSRDLDRDFDLLKYQLGRVPKMMDFIEHESRDPYLYVKSAGSYYNYLLRKEKIDSTIDSVGINVLEAFSKSVANGKRAEDVALLKKLLDKPTVSRAEIIDAIQKAYGYTPSSDTLTSCGWSINLEFIKKKVDLIIDDGVQFSRTRLFDSLLEQEPFFESLADLLRASEAVFNKHFKKGKFDNGFIFYEKYSREDALRILNWQENPVAQNVGGYITHSSQSCFVVFVTYKKSLEEGTLIDYEDRFLNRELFEMISKNNRSLKSPEMVLLRNAVDLRIPFFIKKSDDEGTGFYYLGNMRPSKTNGAFEEDLRGKNKDIKVVKVRFQLDVAVPEELYEYLVDQVI